MEYICDRCKKPIAFIKPVITCNVIDSSTYDWFTYILCRDCKEELLLFLGEKKSNTGNPKKLDFWYGSENATDAVKE